MTKAFQYISILALAAFLVSGFVSDRSKEFPTPSFNAHPTPSRLIGTDIGDEAPDIVLKSPSGKTMKLSSLRGKVVLIDFWASWCRPCRMENPNVVSAYRKYSKAKFKSAKGFEIYSVSLDNQKDRWSKAIKQDHLDWKFHVSDLKGWKSSAATTYGVRSIPASFLIDENGVIIGKNLRGQQLHIAIDQLVKSL